MDNDAAAYLRDLMAADPLQQIQVMEDGLRSQFWHILSARWQQTLDEAEDDLHTGDARDIVRMAKAQASIQCLREVSKTPQVIISNAHHILTERNSV